MKYLILVFAIVPVLAFADAAGDRLENLVDVLSSTPASLNGDVSIGRRAVLGSAPVNMGLIHPNASVEWRENRAIGFGLTESDLSLNTEGAIVIKFMGLTVGVKSIRYTNDGRFHVDLKLPLVDEQVEARVSRILEEKFKTKMDQAFRELSTIRREKGHNASSVIERVVNIFKDPTGANSPLENVPMSGSVELNFSFDQPRTLPISDRYVADIQENDVLSAGARFTRNGSRFNFSEIQFRSYRGVTFRPENGNRASLNSLRVTQVSISDRGIEPVMVSGAEQAVSDVRVLVGLIAAAEGASSLGRAPNCDPRIPEIQAYLQRELNGRLTPLIRQHRAALIRAGIDPEVLNALEG